jgi:proto-oncogene serine/threonine-protein kinase Pim-2
MRTSTRKEDDKRQFHKQYKLGCIIGQGGFGCVYAGLRKKDMKQVAIKELPISNNQQKNQEDQSPQEVALMKKLADVPGVIQLLDFFNMGHSYYVVMERFNSKDMFDFISEQGPLPENLARNLFRQVVDIVMQCHAKGVLHRDIKDENLLIDLTSHQVKLIDFGSGTYLHDGIYTDFEGTRVYSPPEWIKYRQYKADGLTVWSLGVLLYDMLYGDVPFKNDQKIREGHLIWKEEVSISAAAKDVIVRCLEPDPGQRITLHELSQHNWLVEATNVKNDTSSPVQGQPLVEDFKGLCESKRIKRTDFVKPCARTIQIRQFNRTPGRAVLV